MSKRALPIWALLLVVLLASAALWGPGIVNTRGGGDSPFLLQRTHQMAVNLQAGVFPVRWMPDAAYGLGYPFFNHYSALPFYLAASIKLVGLDLLTAIKLTQTLGFLIAALAMYGWILHLWRNRIVAWLAAIAYTVAPFHLVNVYVRGDSLSEFYAFAFYPLVLWALERAVERALEGGSWIPDTAALALAYAGLILTHNISAFIFSPFVVLYLVLLLLRVRPKHSPARRVQGMVRRYLRPFGVGLLGLLLGAAVAAWVWLPALLEQDYVQAENLTGDFFNYANHFRTTNLVQPSLLFDYSIGVSMDDRSPFAMGGLQALVGMAGFLLLLWLARVEGRRTQDGGPTTAKRSSVVFALWSFVFPIIGLLLSTVMITPLSRPLWDHLPLLELVQFPWRFLSVQALLAAMATAALVIPWKGRRAWGVAGAVALLLIASTLLPLRPERLPIGPDDVTTTRLQEYELFTGNIGTTVRYEWLPQAAVPRPFTSDAVIEPEAAPTIIPVSGTLTGAAQAGTGPSEQVWRVQVGAGGATLAFPLLYWPGWHAWVDGEETSVRAIESAGYLALDVPGGAHTVRLRLERTPLRARAETLSLISLLSLLAVLVWRNLRPTLRASRIAYHASRLTSRVIRHIPYAVLVLMALFLLAARSSPPSPRSDDLTMDFVAMPYLHHNPDGIAFGAEGGSEGDSQACLLSYSLSSDQLAPGDVLEATLDWDDTRSTANSIQVSLRLVSPAEQVSDQLRHRASYTLAVSSASLAPTTVHRLSVPANTPRGLYLLQLSLLGPDGELSARTPSGEGRGPLYLRPVRVTEGAPVPPYTPLLALLGPDIRLHTAELEQTTLASGSSALTARLEWSTVRYLATNYGISVRLLDPEGNLTVSTDTQPGYGFAPTSLWRPGERIADRYILSLPSDLPPGDGYRLLLVFYRFPSLAEVARVELPRFALPVEPPVILEPPPRLFELPPLSHRLDVDFTDLTRGTDGDWIQLAGYELGVNTASLELTLWWIAQRQPQVNYTVFVHLFDPADEAKIVTQYDAMPHQGSYPTSGWLAGEVVSDTVRLSLEDVPSGAYRLALGLYDETTGARLAASTPDGATIPHGRLVLSDTVEVSQE